ncbi:MAG: hypothetical protein JSU09_11160 [Bacteroidetes bacterium]|nr:hypothetical protein [Bacteroidota bacterium]
MSNVFVAFLITVSLSVYSQPTLNNKTIWTFTYLKANNGLGDDLKAFLQQNWLAMDKQATEQGLFKQYHLLENNDSTKGWDFVVVVQYRDEKGYEGVKVEFEKIRQNHQRVLVNGKGMAELAKIVKSEDFLEEL